MVQVDEAQRQAQGREAVPDLTHQDDVSGDMVSLLQKALAVGIALQWLHDREASMIGVLSGMKELEN